MEQEKKLDESLPPKPVKRKISTKRAQTAKRRLLSGMGWRTANKTTNNLSPGPYNMRALSATVQRNPKLKWYEQVIAWMRKLIKGEQKKLRELRTKYSWSIEMKTYLEQLLWQCVDDVKSEITWKKSENKVMFYKQKKRAQTAKSRWRTANLRPGENLTNQEREKIIEVLMS